MARAWAPRAQWTAVRRPTFDAESMGHAGWLIPFIVYFIAGSLSARLITPLEPHQMAALTIAGGLALRAVHWTRLRRYYETVDLPGVALARSA
jgi:hypothetical protein